VWFLETGSGPICTYPHSPLLFTPPRAANRPRLRMRREDSRRCSWSNGIRSPPAGTEHQNIELARVSQQLFGRATHCENSQSAWYLIRPMESVARASAGTSQA
jgi:hypothetical protein